MPKWLTISGAAIAAAVTAAAPVIVPHLPAEYSAAAVGVLALMTNLYHLFQPSPDQKVG